MSCQNIDLYGAALIPICIGFGDTTPMVLEITNKDTGDNVLTDTATIKLHIYKPGNKEVVSLDGVIDITTATFTFTTAFWSALNTNAEYTYKIIMTDGPDVTTLLASDFNIK